MSKLFLVLDFVCNSRATCLLIYSGIRHKTYYHCSGPLLHFVSGIERLPTCLKLPMIPPYFTLDNFLSFNSRVTFRHLPRYYRPDSQPYRGPFSRNAPPLFFHKHDEDPKKGRQLHPDGSISSRKAIKTEKT